MDDKGEVMILVGYHSIAGYKLFDAEKRIVISLDIIVDEIRESQQPVINYVKVVTDYSFEKSNSAETERAKTLVTEI